MMLFFSYEYKYISISFKQRLIFSAVSQTSRFQRTLKNVHHLQSETVLHIQ